MIFALGWNANYKMQKSFFSYLFNCEEIINLTSAQWNNSELPIWSAGGVVAIWEVNSLAVSFSDRNLLSTVYSMSFLNTLRQWDQAVACVEQGDVETALGTFVDICEKNSKISFNIGCLHLAKDDFEAAEKVCSSFRPVHWTHGLYLQLFSVLCSKCKCAILILI